MKLTFTYQVSVDLPVGHGKNLENYAYVKGQGGHTWKIREQFLFKTIKKNWDQGRNISELKRDISDQKREPWELREHLIMVIELENYKIN